MNDELTTLIDQLGIVSKQRTEAEERVKPLAEQEAGLRQQILNLMSERGVKSQADHNHGINVVAVTRKDYKIADETAARAALSNMGFLDQCMKLDAAAVKKLAKEQQIDGVEETEMLSLTVREAA